MTQVIRGTTHTRTRQTDKTAALRAASWSTPSVDDVEFSDLYDLEEVTVDTEDGWRLVMTRYRPRPQTFPQPPQLFWSTSTEMQ